MSDYIRVTNDDELIEHFEGILIPAEDIAGKYQVPGWKCKSCGWAVGTIRYPPGHHCPEDGQRQRGELGVERGVCGVPAYISEVVRIARWHDDVQQVERVGDDCAAITYKPGVDWRAAESVIAHEAQLHFGSGVSPA